MLASSRVRSVLGGALCVLVLACSDKRGSPDARTSATSGAAPEPPKVDPRVSSLAQAALPCALASGVFDLSCAGMRAWVEARDPFVEGRADGALVAMLADKDERVRYLASYKLNQFGRRFATDEELAGLVLTAAESERSAMAGMELGATVGRIAVHATRTYDRVEAIVKKHPSAEVRRGVLSQVLFRNPSDPKVFELTRATVDDADTTVAMAALRAFWTGGTSNAEATCKVYLAHVASSNVEMAAEASNALAWFGRCASGYDKLLDSLEARVKPGAAGVSDPSFASAARHVCEDAKATDSERKRAAAFGRAIVTREDLPSSVRLAALEAADRCDRTGAGRAFVAKLKTDPDKAIADKAKELAAKK